MSYQAIFDAVRSRIYNGDIAQAVKEALFQSVDFYPVHVAFQNAAADIAAYATRPSVLYRPSIGRDGTAWCVLLGDNIQEGVCGFGDSPEAACRAFDQAWTESSPQRVK